MKKFFLSLFAAVAFLNISSLAFADSYTEAMTHIADRYFNDPYLSISTGVAYLMDDEKNTSAVPIGSLPPIIEEKEIQGNKAAVMENLAVGYGRIIAQKYYLGGELFVQHAPLKLSFAWNTKSTINPSIFNFTNKVTADRFYGAAIKGGWLLSQRTLFYLLLGYERAMIKAQYLIEDYSTILHSYRLLDDQKKSSVIGGIVTGFGLETYLTQRFSIKGQYTHTFYGSITHTNSVKTETLSVTQKAKDDFQLGIFSIGLSYYLG